jgi:hypothetical protein
MALRKSIDRGFLNLRAAERGGAFCRRCWWALRVAKLWVCFPVVLAETQGRLAEARLTLGLNPQPFQDWCIAEWFGKMASFCQGAL